MSEFKTIMTDSSVNNQNLEKQEIQHNNNRRVLLHLYSVYWVSWNMWSRENSAKKLVEFTQFTSYVKYEELVM